MDDVVGIVGVGRMGQAFAHHLLQAGFEVHGFDLEAKRMDELAGRGGIPAVSPAAAARGARWILTSLPNSEAVRNAVLGPAGIVEGAAGGAILADTTTSRPQDSERLGAELAARGIRFLDAAVSGTSAMAWKKDLVVLAGGAPEDFAAGLPCLQAIGRAAYRMGPVGAGALTKLIVNLVLAGNRLALAEGLVLGMKAGMAGESLLAVLQDSACSSKTMGDKGPKMLRGDYTPEGLVGIALKDAHLMLEQGRRFGAPLLLTSLWAQVLQAAAAGGLLERDTVAFIEVLRDLAGLPRRA